LLRLFRQPVDALEHAVDIGPGAGALHLQLQLLDRRARCFVRVFHPSLDLALQVRRDAVLCFAQGAPAGAHRAPNDA
jgi:hypothetical protein